MKDLCHCGSNRAYSSCCGLFLENKAKPETAEQLMRSRYTAFVMNHMDYITQTHHPSSRSSVDTQANTAWSTEADWIGLEILKTVGGQAEDLRGQVEFVARYRRAGVTEEHHELSDFKKENGVWFFFDGKIVGKEAFVRPEPKVGRNDPCPCGSGAKFKKCCG